MLLILGIIISPSVRTSYIYISAPPGLLVRDGQLVGLVRLLSDSRRRREVGGDEADVEVDADGVGDLVLALLVPEALDVLGDHRPEGRVHVRILE